MAATISIPTHARRPVRQPAPTSEATYRRRRTVVGAVAAAIVAVGVVTAHDVLAGSGGVPASAAVSQPAHVRTTVTAQPGDTLWSIAAGHHGDVSLSRYVDKLVDLNGGAAIQAGQAVILP
jgi:nucleoid-associated protein YgaU